MWLRVQACIFGNVDALHNLAGYYACSAEEGTLPKSVKKTAYNMYKRGAIKGHAGCQYDYGLGIVLGEVEGKKKEEGLNLIKLAAERGYPAAEMFMDNYPA
jgi:hypothetical protein